MRSHRQLRCLLLLLTLAVVGSAAAVAREREEKPGPADPLLRLVPPDAGVTLAIEDLRGHARRFFGSPLSEGLRRLPVVRAWLESERFRGFTRALGQIEEILGEKVATIRDDLLGDAVVLSLRLPANGRQEEARGMLLLRVRSRPLLDRLIAGVNAAQKKDGDLLRIVERTRRSTRYQARMFAARTAKAPEYYAVLDDTLFAMSNSEELIQGVIDCQEGEQVGLGDEPNFRKVRRALPPHPIASLFVNPRFVESMMAAAPPSPKPGDERVVSLLAGYLGAVDYAGAALEWRDGLILHTEEVLDPEKAAPWVRRWAQAASVAPRLGRVPATALAITSLHVDFGAIEELVVGLTPAPERRKLENMEAALGGLLLGNDLKSAILPRLGPGVLAYLEAVPGSAALAPVVQVDLKAQPGGADVSFALENTLRTLLALYALDPKHGDGQLHLESGAETGTSRVTALAPSSPFAFAVDRDRLVLGKSAASVARALLLPPPGDDRFARLRAAYFPEAATFLAADLTALHQFGTMHREALAAQIAEKNHAPVEGAARDLDQALALITLFRSAFVTQAIEPDVHAIHRMLGLIEHSPAAPARP